MPLHRLACLTMGVPNVDETALYYQDFGLTTTTTGPADTDQVHRFETLEGGEQLRLTYAPRRRLLAMDLEADNPDDLARASAQLNRLEMPHSPADGVLSIHDPGTDVEVTVRVAPRRTQTPTEAPVMNWHGQWNRVDERAPAVFREYSPKPRRLGHVVLTSTQQERSRTLFEDALGFKVSDEVVGVGAFMRCSDEHHNIVVAAAPVPFVHHTSWQLNDVDDIGRKATAMLEQDPTRHVWGLGRHYVGSNYFWYLKDPAGNFSEYYSDMDCVINEREWKAQIHEGVRGLYSWGPPPPPDFGNPKDMADLMAEAH